MKTVDARDLACPEPVVRTMKALESIAQGQLTVLVNSPESCQNVQRYAQNQGCSVKVAEKNGEFTIKITKEKPSEGKEKTGTDILLITGDRFGEGDADLGQLLLITFVNTLTEAYPRPSRMIFLNRGVMLTTEGSRVLDTLKQLEKEGVQVFSCGTCLNHYQLKEKLQVGKVTNMYDIVDSLLAAKKVVRI